MRTWIGLLASFSVVVSFAACKGDGGGGDGGVLAQPIPEEELPDATAEALCELLFGCSCDNPNYADEAACVDTRRTTASEEQLAAQAAGLIYDEQCAGDLLALAEGQGCAPQVTLSCDSFCAVYHGQQGADEPCTMPVEDQPTWSDCAPGLWCVAGTCVDACGNDEAGLGLGEMCRDDEGQSLGSCAEGLWCELESGTCIALPDVGEPCYGGEVCGPGAICDWSGDEAVCVPIPGQGEACTYACDAGLYCTGVDGGEGICEALPGEGQPCTAAGLCAEGHACNEESVCEGLPAWVCSI
ncbi:MAG: hypothetical protein R6X02_16060 [Enhygromyxa sp.]